MMYCQIRRLDASTKRTKHTKNKRVSLLSWRVSNSSSVSSSLSSSTLRCLNSLRNCALTSSFYFCMEALTCISLSLFLILLCRALPFLTSHTDITMNKAHTHTNTPRDLNRKRNTRHRKDDKFKPRRTQIHPICYFSWKFVLIFICH